MAMIPKKLLALLACFCLWAPCLFRASTPAPVFSEQSPSAPILSVPVSQGKPITLDGLLSTAEWQDALCVSNGSVSLYLKKIRSDVFIAVNSPICPNPGLDLFISPETAAEIHQLHISTEIRERRLPYRHPPEVDPKDTWTSPSGWTAGTMKTDMLSCGGPGFGPSWVTTWGVEMKIEQSKFRQSLWNMRLELSFPPRYERSITFPQKSDKDDSFRWLAFQVL